VHLSHLIGNRGITVYDQRTGEFVFWTGESLAREMIAEGKIQAEGPRASIRRLVWIGPPLTPQLAEKAREGPLEGPDLRQSAPYTNKHASDTNVENVWTYAGRSTVLESVFMTVMAGCGARIRLKKQRRKRARRP
jgi:hypothetical protein